MLSVSNIFFLAVKYSKFLIGNKQNTKKHISVISLQSISDLKTKSCWEIFINSNHLVNFSHDLKLNSNFHFRNTLCNYNGGKNIWEFRSDLKNFRSAHTPCTMLGHTHFCLKCPLPQLSQHWRWRKGDFSQNIFSRVLWKISCISTIFACILGVK